MWIFFCTFVADYVCMRCACAPAHAIARKMRTNLVQEHTQLHADTYAVSYGRFSHIMSAQTVDTDVHRSACRTRENRLYPAMRTDGAIRQTS